MNKKGEEKMLKTIDVGLMANHLSAHKGVISRLELYTKHAKEQQLVVILQKQIGIMKNHVEVMNQLLNPNQNNNLNLPPIPLNVPIYQNQSNQLDIGIDDRNMALDAHFTATAMANDNFVSATNMKDPQVKRIHVEMALQQSDIANLHENLAHQLGWLTHPNATSIQQNEAMSPLGKFQQNSTVMNVPPNLSTQNQNRIN
jgi:hypothetical protein